MSDKFLLSHKLGKAEKLIKEVALDESCDEFARLVLAEALWLTMSIGERFEREAHTLSPLSDG